MYKVVQYLYNTFTKSHIPPSAAFNLQLSIQYMMPWIKKEKWENAPFKLYIYLLIREQGVH